MGGVGGVCEIPTTYIPLAGAGSKRINPSLLATTQPSQAQRACARTTFAPKCLKYGETLLPLLLFTSRNLKFIAKLAHHRTFELRPDHYCVIWLSCLIILATQCSVQCSGHAEIFGESPSKKIYIYFCCSSLEV